jgi:hypothetical protein
MSAGVPGAGDDPIMNVEEDVEEVLLALQRAILLYPAAAQGLFYALVQEGRRFARTPEGAVLQQSLCSSELVIRSRVLWDSLTVRALEDDPDTVVPTAVLEAITKAASDRGMETILEDLFIRNVFLGGAEER